MKLPFLGGARWFFRSFKNYREHTIDSIFEEESGEVFDTAGTDSDQTGSDPNPPAVDGQDRLGNLASVLSAFLSDSSGIGKIIRILLLLLLMFLIVRVVLKRSKNNRY